MIHDPNIIPRGTWSDGDLFQTEDHAVISRNICHGKGQGQQSGQQQVTSTTNTSNLPEYARPYFESLLNRAQEVSNDPYQAYTGQRQAGFTQPQNTAFQNVQNAQGIANPYFDTGMSLYDQSKHTFNRAEGAYNNAGGAFNQALGIGTGANFDPNQVTNSYQAQSYNPNGWTDSGVASQYMSPYIQNVLNIQSREANRQFGIQNTQNEAAAQRAGAFGGYRHGIVDAEAQRNQQQLLADIEQKGLQSAYDTGLGAFNQDRSAFMGANQLNNQFAQQQAGLTQAAQNANNQWDLAGQNLRLQGGQLALGAGQGMLGMGQGIAGVGQGYAGLGQGVAGMGQARQQSALTDAQSLLNIGAMQQAQNQQGLDIGYQDFINQRDYQRQNLGWLSGILRGVPTTANTNTTGYQAAPSTVSQLTGLGLGAAGLYKMFS